MATIRSYPRQLEAGETVLECGRCSALVYADNEGTGWADHVAGHETIDARLAALEARP